MKRVFLVITAAVSLGAHARTFEAMNYVEKSSYALQRLVNQHQVDASYLTDVDSAKVSVSSSGATVVLSSPSAMAGQKNSLTLVFDTRGTMTANTNDFKSAQTSGPLFSPANSATILDLGAEAVVDHLAQSADLPVVSKTAQTVELAREGTGVHLRSGLADGRIYHIMMDTRARVISKGF